MEMIRRAIIEVLEENEIEKPIILHYSKEELKDIIFDKEIVDNRKKCYVIAKEINKVIHKINFINISFDDVNVERFDFSKMTGVKINPQKVYKKSLQYANLSGVEFISGKGKNSRIDMFEGVNIRGVKFEGNKNIRINPQTIYQKDLTETKLNGIDFTDCSFDDVTVVNADFTGATGVKINPQIIKNKQLTKAKLFGVDFTGYSFDNAIINYTDFTGSIGAIINPNKINNIEFRIGGELTSNTTGFYNTNCIDVILTDIPNPDIIVDGALFNDDNINQLKEEKEKHKEKIKTLIKFQK